MITISVIGLGDMGMAHVRGFNMLDNCEIIAVCDVNDDRLEIAKTLLHGKKVILYNDYHKLMSIKGLDAVVVAVPNHLHREVAISALKAGKDLFLEKPVAHTFDDCDDIIKCWSETDRIAQIGFTYRYSSLYRYMAGMIEQGNFGNVMMAYCKEYRDNFPMPWFFYEDKSGGAIVEKNCHHFDLFNWFINSRPARVFAMGGQHVVKGKNYKIQCSYAEKHGTIVDDPTIIDHAYINVEYENGALSNLGLCMYEIAPIEGLQIGIIGDNGAHATATKDSELEYGGGPLGGMQYIGFDLNAETGGIGHIGCQTERKEFLKCIKKRKYPYANLSTGRDAASVCFAAERSIRERRVVEMPEYDNEDILSIFKAKEYALNKKTPEPVNKPLFKKKE